MNFELVLEWPYEQGVSNMSTERKRPTCPECQSLMIPYVWGEPSMPPTEDGGPDDFFMMGCTLDIGVASPEWGCRKCDDDWLNSDLDDMEDIYASVAAATVWFPRDGGQGVLVNDSDDGRLIITAAHCIAQEFKVEEVVHGDLFPQAVKINEREFTVRSLTVEPFADIAIMGALDGQEFPDEADAFLTFCADIEPVPLCQKDLEIGDEFPVHIYTHKAQWITGNASYYGGPRLHIEADEQLEGGTSGGPIINDSGELVGVVSNARFIEDGGYYKSGGSHPYPSLALPVWVCRRIWRRLLAL
jgi:S1-C subfamily serine protease